MKKIRAALTAARFNGAAGPGGDKLSNEEMHAVEDLVEAIEQDRYSFVYEAWHAEQGVVAYEMLLRAYDSRPANDDSRIDLGAAVAGLTKLELRAKFDEILIQEELKWAKRRNLTPVTLNLSMEAIYSETFWENMEGVLDDFGPENIIFEILEDPIPEQDSHRIGHLRNLRAAGYRFAMDDYRPCLRDVQRMQALGKIVSFVKLDGHLVRDGLDDGDPALDRTIAALSPHYNLVAEWVTDAAEADELFKKNVHCVQGRDLPLGAGQFRMDLAHHRGQSRRRQGGPKPG